MHLSLRPSRSTPDDELGTPLRTGSLPEQCLKSRCQAWTVVGYVGFERVSIRPSARLRRLRPLSSGGCGGEWVAVCRGCSGRRRVGFGGAFRVGRVQRRRLRVIRCCDRLGRSGRWRVIWRELLGCR